MQRLYNGDVLVTQILADLCRKQIRIIEIRVSRLGMSQNV